MRRYLYSVFRVAIVVGACGSVADAKIVSVNLLDPLPEGGLHNPYWVFDHQLQHLTIVGDVYLRSGTGSDAPDTGGYSRGGGLARSSGGVTGLEGAYESLSALEGPSWPWGEPLYNCVGASIRGFSGRADSDSVLHVTGIFTNRTGIAWTGWLIGWRADYIWGNTPLENVTYVSSSNFSKATDVWMVSHPAIVVTGSPAVLPNEVVTLNFDIYVGAGSFYDDLGMVPIVPEPASVVLFGVGGIAVLERQRRRRRWLKA